MNIIEQIEQEEIIRQTDKREVPTFGPGDTLRVSVRVVELWFYREKNFIRGGC